MSLLLSIALVANSPIPSTKALDMNDLSILMPIVEKPEILEILPHLNQNNVYDWTEQQRNEMLSKLSSHIEPIRDPIQDFVLASIRIDPCANRLSLKPEAFKSDCSAEFRLVWQKLAGSSLRDSNVHTIYKMNRDELADTLGRMNSLHEKASLDTRGQALAPHPVISSEGKNSPYLQGVLKIVADYARKEALIEVAHMVANTERNWTFGHIGVENGQAQFMAIPTFGQDEIDIVNVNDTINTPEGSNFTVHTYGKIGELKSKGILADKEYPLELKRELDFYPILNRTVEAFAVENPDIFSPKNINCSSCHTAEKLKAGHAFVEEVSGGQVWKSKFAKPSFAYPKNAKGLIPRTAEQGEFLPLASYAVYAYVNPRWNMEAPFAKTRQTSMQMFSYNSVEEAVIATRVVNDTAVSLDMVQELF